MSFPCTRCGLCCQNIGSLPELVAFNRGDGVCMNYDVDNGCLVYSNRPLVCRIDDGYERYAADKMTKDRYLAMNAEVCNKLQDEAGISREFRVFL